MKKSKVHAFLWPLLIIVTSAALIVNLLWPDADYTNTENRPLAGFPAIRTAALWNGWFGRELESYAADQLVGRDLFFHLNYLFRKLAGQREIDYTYLGKGALYLKPTPNVPEIADRNAETVAKFAASYDIPVSLMIVPDAMVIQKENLPPFTPESEANDVIDHLYSMAGSAEVLDVRPLLERYKDEYIFYRTDHHWTSNMAGLASGMVVEGFNSFQLSDYQPYLVSNNFEGSLAARTGSIFLHDDVYIYVSKNNPEYVVTWADGSKSGTIYRKQALQEKDQYQVFLGPNQSIINIETMADSERSLLILKDSYANSMIQFLLPYYRHITIIDPRYFYEDLSYVITSQQITEVLIESWYDTFVSETALSNVLESANLASVTLDENGEVVQESGEEVVEEVVEE